MYQANISEETEIFYVLPPYNPDYDADKGELVVEEIYTDDFYEEYQIPWNLEFGEDGEITFNFTEIVDFLNKEKSADNTADESGEIQQDVSPTEETITEEPVIVEPSN
jgi:hypothetical protein